MISDSAPLPAGEPTGAARPIPAELPPWAMALPLWAGARWLWLTVTLDGLLRYSCRGEVTGSGQGTLLTDLPLDPPYPLIVLDCGAARLPAAWWPQVAALLAPGGVLFVCGLHGDPLIAPIQGASGNLQPARWHLLEPSIDGGWRLRPDEEPIRRLLDDDLQPPYSVRDLLTQARRRWHPAAAGRLACLPVWHTGAAPLSALLQGALPPALLSAVAGHAVREPLALLHMGQAGTRQARHLLFLIEAGARYPFALVKWARGPAAGLEREHRALTQMRAVPDPVIATSCPPSWGPFPAGPDTRVTVERYLPARVSYAQLRTSVWPQRLAAVHFGRAATWLAHFAAATRQPPRPFDAALLEQTIEAPLRRFVAQFGAAALPPAALVATLAQARAHLGGPIAQTAEHGDLWLANLLLPRSGGLYVIDWEYYQPAALPGFDMLLFSTTYALELPWRPFGWERPPVALHRAYCTRNWLTPHIARFLGRVCAASGLPRTLVPVLIPVMLARMALRRADGSPPGPAAPDNFWLSALEAWWQRPAHSWIDHWVQEETAAISRPDPAIRQRPHTSG